MLIRKLDGSVDSSALLGDVELDVKLLFHHIITANMLSIKSGRPQELGCDITDSEIWLKTTHS